MERHSAMEYFVRADLAVAGESGTAWLCDRVAQCPHTYTRPLSPSLLPLDRPSCTWSGRCSTRCVRYGDLGRASHQRCCVMEACNSAHCSSVLTPFRPLPIRPALLQAWQAADLGGDGRLDKREFCLFVQLLRGAQKGCPLPLRLNEAEAAALLGERPMPASAPNSGRAAGPEIHIDSARMRAALAGGHSRQESMEQSVIQVRAGISLCSSRRPVPGFCHSSACWEVGKGAPPAILLDITTHCLPAPCLCTRPSAPPFACTHPPAPMPATHKQAQDDDSDGASSIDSGICESVSGMSISSRRPAGPPASLYALGRPSAQPHARTGLGSVLGGGGGGAAATAGAYHPAAPGSLRLGAATGAPGGAAEVAQHSLLEVAVHSAQIRYRKPLSTPIFTLSVS